MHSHTADIFPFGHCLWCYKVINCSETNIKPFNIPFTDFLESSVIDVDFLTENTYVTHDRKLYVVDTGGSKREILNEDDVHGVIKSIAVYDRCVSYYLTVHN